MKRDKSLTKSSSLDIEVFFKLLLMTVGLYFLVKYGRNIANSTAPKCCPRGDN